MRKEILFRGKRCSDGEWVYGFYVESKCSWQGHKPHKSWIVPNAISNGGFFNVLGRYAVKDDTVGQFTGLVDKNGVKIFEGDIVRVCDSDYDEYSDQQVKFAHGVFGVDNWTKKYLTTLSFFLTGGDSEYSVEVIGNRYDNPERLDAK